MKFDIWVFFEKKTVQNVQVSLKSVKNNGYFTRRPKDFLIISRSVRLRMRNVSGKKTYQRKSKHTFCIKLLFFLNRAFYEIMWKTFVERVRTQMAIWCMRNACWIAKATLTHTHTHHMVARTRLNVKLHVHCLSCHSYHRESCSIACWQHSLPSVTTDSVTYVSATRLSINVWPSKFCFSAGKNYTLISHLQIRAVCDVFRGSLVTKL
jgi:hypothetical protein